MSSPSATQSVSATPESAPSDEIVLRDGSPSTGLIESNISNDTLMSGRSAQETGRIDSSINSSATAPGTAKVVTYYDQNLSAINRCVLDSVPEREPTITSSSSTSTTIPSTSTSTTEELDPKVRENFERNMSSLQRCVLDSYTSPSTSQPTETEFTESSSTTTEPGFHANYDRNPSSLDRCVLDTPHEMQDVSSRESQRKPMKLYVTDPLDSKHAFPPLNDDSSGRKKLHGKQKKNIFQKKKK